MLASTFLATPGADLLPAAAVVQNVVSGAGKYLLLAIPLFLMTGSIMNESGLSARLIDLAHALVGHLRGGLAQVNVVQSFLFGGISGSSTSDAALDSKILVPQMVRNGYRAEFSCAITAASAVLPNIVPPSIAILIYASIADLSVAKLFIAAVVPGCLLAACLMAAVHVLARRRGYGQGSARASVRQRLSAIWRAAPVLFVIVIIVLGIRFGVVTPTEAGVVAVLWSFLLWRVLAADFRWSGVYAAFTSCAAEAAMIGLLIGAATPFAYVLISERVPQAVVAAVMGGVSEGWVVLLVMNLIMLAAGTVLNVSAAMLILMPLFLPVVAALGIDTIHFGLIVVVNLVMGGITPPVGVLVFITATISRTPVHLVFRETGPLLVALLIGLALITYVPAITLEPVRWAF
jgi:tripartite ATP-independent transporter DctM subunit